MGGRAQGPRGGARRQGRPERHHRQVRGVVPLPAFLIASYLLQCRARLHLAEVQGVDLTVQRVALRRLRQPAMFAAGRSSMRTSLALASTTASHAGEAGAGWLGTCRALPYELGQRRRSCRVLREMLGAARAHELQPPALRQLLILCYAGSQEVLQHGHGAGEPRGRAAAQAESEAAVHHGAPAQPARRGHGCRHGSARQRAAAAERRSSCGRHGGLSARGGGAGQQRAAVFGAAARCAAADRRAQVYSSVPGCIAMSLSLEDRSRGRAGLVSFCPRRTRRIALGGVRDICDPHFSSALESFVWARAHSPCLQWSVDSRTHGP